MAFQLSKIIPKAYMIPGVIVTVVLISVIILVSTLSTPGIIGITSGKLAACPDSPNCISSEASDKSQYMPPVSFKGEPTEVIGLLKAFIQKMPRTKIIAERDNYLHAEFTSLIFRFVDDVEFYADAERNEIHFRSASRVGHSDLGVNRSRLESIFEKLGKENLSETRR